MKKVALITGDSSLSGAPKHILRLAINLKERGWEVLVILPPGPLVKQLDEAEINHKQVEMGNGIDRKAYHKIRRQISIFDPDVVHCHGMRGGLLGRLAARRMKVPVIYTEHLWTKHYHLSNPAYEKAQITAQKFLDRYTTKTIAVSGAVKDFLVRKKFKPGKIVVILNGIDPKFAKTELIKKPKGIPIIFGSVGALNRQKNYIRILKAVTKIKKEHPDLMFHYQIIGEGPDRKKLVNIVKRLKLERIVHFTGRVEKVEEQLKHFSFFVTASMSESFGLAAAEALSMGLPVVASDAGGLKDIVHEGCGFLIDPRDIDEISQAIYKLITDDKLREEMSDCAREDASKRFSESKMVDKIVTLYEKVIRSHK